MHTAITTGLFSVFIAISFAYGQSSSTSVKQIQSAETRVAVVELQGAFGQEIIASAVEAALLRAEKESCEAIVFTLESDGGLTHDARTIANLINDHPDHCRIFTVASTALSASVWLLAASDELAMTNGGSVGAAAAITVSSDGTVKPVEQKRASALAGMLASLADSNGQNGAFYRAFTDQLAELWFYDIAPTPLVSNHRLDKPGGIQLDTDKNILTLSSAQAEKYGFASVTSSLSNADLSKLVSMGALDFREGPQKAYRGAAARYQKAIARSDREQDKINEYHDQIEMLIKKTDEQIRRAETLDPRKMTLWYYESDGLLTPSSQIRWRRAVSEERTAWHTVVSYLEEIASIEKKAISAANRRERLLAQIATMRHADTPESVSAAIDSSTKAELEVRWEHAQERIRWCNSHEKRYMIDDHRP